MSPCRFRVLVAIMTMDHGIGSPSVRGVAPRQGGRRWPPGELENTGETWPRWTERVDSMEWPDCPRSPRRPTRRDGMAPDNQRSWYPPAIQRACGVPNDGEQQRRIPARYPRACAGRGWLGVAGVGGVAGGGCRVEGAWRVWGVRQPGPFPARYPRAWPRRVGFVIVRQPALSPRAIASVRRRVGGAGCPSALPRI